MLLSCTHRKDFDEFVVNFTVFVGSFIESTERLRKVSHGSLGLPRPRTKTIQDNLPSKSRQAKIKNKNSQKITKPEDLN